MFSLSPCMLNLTFHSLLSMTISCLFPSLICFHLYLSLLLYNSSTCLYPPPPPACQVIERHDVMEGTERGRAVGNKPHPLADFPYIPPRHIRVW